MKFCVGCGKNSAQIEFPTAFAVRCVDCSVDLSLKKKERKANYRNARLRALTRLSHAYPEDYKRFLAEEQAEEDAKQRKEAPTGKADVA